VRGRWWTGLVPTILTTVTPAPPVASALGGAGPIPAMAKRDYAPRGWAAHPARTGFSRGGG
jgi:hypothetical protein